MFKTVFNDVANGKLVSPRGELTREIRNYQYTIGKGERFANFPSRKLSLAYIKEELIWYIKGDKNDLSICDKAVIWKKMVANGVLHSNYGQYIFKAREIDYVVEVLKRDKDSRRAVMTILNPKHLYWYNTDVPCTVSMSYCVRDGKLHSTVHMRSQDVIYGMGNDVPFFSIVQEMVAVMLKLEVGELTVFVESLHVYEKHFSMLDKLLTEENVEIACPAIECADEVKHLRDQTPYFQYPFSRWLYASE